MSQILVEIDPKLKQSDIVMPLASPNSSQKVEGTNKNTSGNQQTSVYGILTPLIAINNTVIAFEDVIEMTLKNSSKTPTISIIANDTQGNLENIDNPGQDNELRLQIIPPFDNAYKKINLTFYLTTLNVSGGVIKARGIYKVPKFTSSNIKSFGEIDTYNLFKQIAQDTDLGFATNATEDESDKRFVYCDNKSYEELMAQQIQYSGNETKILDYWIDFWNNINLVDMYNRYHSVDPVEELMIWTGGQPNEMTEDIDVRPVKMEAVLTNHPSMNNTDLFITDKILDNNCSSNIMEGTDRVLAIYDQSKKLYMDHLLQNGTPQKDIFARYEYMGESYGKQNYIMNKICRKTYLNVIDASNITVVANSPCLGLMRGKQVKLQWYINDDEYKNKLQSLEDAGLITPDSEMTTNVDIDPPLTPEQQEHYNPSSGEWLVDKNISGQYLILGNEIKYFNGIWQNTMTLTRPSELKPHKINVTE